MINLNKLRWSGFYSFGKDEQEFVFEPGFYLVIGRNGSGKSSFMNLISLALFDKSPSIGKRSAINDNLSSGKIELSFSIGESIYDLLYSREKDSFVWLLKRGDLEVVSGKETGEYLERLLGFGYDQFVNAFYLTQSGSLSMRLVYGMPSERLDILSKVFDLEKFEEASDLSKIKKAEVESMRLELDRELEVLRGELESYRKMDLDIRSKKEAIFDLQEELDVLVEDLREDEKLKEDIVQKRERIKKGYMDIERIRESELVFGRIEIERLRSRIDEVLKKIKLRKEWEEWEGEYLRLISDLREREMGLDSLREEIGKKREKRAVLNEEVERLKDKLEGIMEGEGICDRCGSLVSESSLERFREKTEEEIKICWERWREVQSEIEDSELEFKREEGEFRELEEKKIEIESRYRDIRDIDFSKLEKEKEGFIKELREREKRVKEKEDEIKDLELAIRKMVNEVNEEEKQREEIDKVRKRVFEIDARIKELRLKIEEIRRIEEQKNRVWMSSEKKKEEIGRLVSIEDGYKFWIKGFKDIQMLRMVRMLGSISEKVTDLLRPFGMRCYFDVLEEKKSSRSFLSLDDYKRKINIFVKAEGKERVPVEAYSGGEKQLLTLCLVLAMGEVVSDINYLALDEVFGMLDTVNRDRVIDLLERERRDGGLENKCVLVVSHDDEIKSGMDWDGVIEVEKSSGYSRIRRVTL